VAQDWCVYATIFPRGYLRGGSRSTSRLQYCDTICPVAVKRAKMRYKQHAWIVFSWLRLLSLHGGMNV
jgi:hypothetical protein